MIVSSSHFLNHLLFRAIANCSTFPPQIVIPYVDKEAQDYETFCDYINVDRIRYLWLGKGKSQGDSIKIGKVFKQGLSELTKPLEGSVGFLKGVGEGVAE